MSTLKQNTTEWLLMRKSKIGASDAPIIMKESIYSTPYRLWQQKLNLLPEVEQNWAMKRGHDLEPIARKKLEEMTGILFVPVVKFHPTLEWMMCSSDGMALDESTMTEIKCPGKEDHQKALAGVVPQKYFAQLQHQLEVCEMDSMIYFSFDGQDGAMVKVYRDDKYIKKMLKEEHQFFECMQSFKEPDLTVRDYKNIDDINWAREAEEYKKDAMLIKELEDKQAERKNFFISMANDQSSYGNGIFVRKVTQKGRVDYSTIPELKLVNLEGYRKPSSQHWKLFNGKNI